MNNIPSDYWGIIGLLVFIIFILIDKIIVPQYRKKKPAKQMAIYLGDNPHPVSLDAFYQAFVDHDEHQEKWAEEIKKEILRIWRAVRSLDKRIDDIDKRVLIVEEKGKRR